jgi:hypothetical protein
MMISILAVLLIAGCTISPEKEVLNISQKSASSIPSEERYVQINLLDGTSVGGKYVSQNGAFTVIIVMYMINPKASRYYKERSVKDPNRYIVRGNGTEVGFKSSLIETIVAIDDPEQVIEKTQQEIRDEMADADKAYEKAYEERMKRAEKERERYLAEIARRMPNRQRRLMTAA